MALNSEKEHRQMRDEERHTLCPMRSAWALLRGLLASSLVARGRHLRLPSSLAASVTFTLPMLPPCFCPFLLPKEKRDGAREDEGERRDVVGSSGLSLRDGWFYPNAINSSAPRVHALRVKLTLVPRASFTTGIAMPSLDLERRCIPLLWVLELRNHFIPRKSMAADECRIDNNVPTFWIRIKRSSRQKKQKCAYLRGRDLIIYSHHKKLIFLYIIMFIARKERFCWNI